MASILWIGSAIVIFVRSAIAFRNESIFQSRIGPKRPCWCQALEKKVSLSKGLLESAYTKSALRFAPIFSKDGNGDSLVNRLTSKLQSQEPFKIGVLGGSFSSICGAEDRNVWQANVTRWLNSMLSTSACSPRENIPVTIPRSNCKFRLYGHREYPYECVNASVITREVSPVFCSRFATDEEYASHHRHIRPLNEICAKPLGEGASVDCAAFLGSGKFATQTSGNKGNTRSSFGEAFNSRLLEPREGYDFILWDFSPNDEDGTFGEPWKSIGQGFFDSVFRNHNKSVGIGMVYWPDTRNWNDEQHLIRFNKSCYHKQIRNELASVQYRVLKHLFHPVSGKFRNKALLTVSLGRFCNIHDCVLHDILHQHTGHPNPSGISLMADVVIWQLLRAFRVILSRHCTGRAVQSVGEDNLQHNDHHMKSAASANQVGNIDDHRRGNATATVSLFTDNHPTFPAVFRSNGLEPGVVDYYRQYPLSAAVESRRSDGQVAVIDINLVASLLPIMPTHAAPPPIAEVAMLCAPSTAIVEPSSHFVYSVFDLAAGANLSASVPLTWTALDMRALQQAGCAGWTPAMEYIHFPGRIDSEHLYVPTAVAMCPLGFRRSCPKPDWIQQQLKYPHPTYSALLPGRIKTVDLVVRLSTSLQWTHVCFLRHCPPKLFYQHQRQATTTPGGTSSTDTTTGIGTGTDAAAGTATGTATGTAGIATGTAAAAAVAAGIAAGTAGSPSFGAGSSNINDWTVLDSAQTFQLEDLQYPDGRSLWKSFDGCFALKPQEPPIASKAIDYIYLWYSADDCFPPRYHSDEWGYGFAKELIVLNVGRSAAG